MEPRHYQAIQKLARCRFLPGSFDKCFVRSMAMLGPYDLLSERQAEWVERMAYRYRRQMARMVVNRQTEAHHAPLDSPAESDTLVGQQRTES